MFDVRGFFLKTFLTLWKDGHTGNKEKDELRSLFKLEPVEEL